MNIKNKKHILKKFIAMVLIAGVVTVEAGAITASAAEPTNSPMSATVDQCDFLCQPSSRGLRAMAWFGV